MQATWLKAQSSFEMVIIASVVTALAFAALAAVPKIANSTGAIAVLKSEILSTLSKYDKFYFIESIDSPMANPSQGQTEIKVYIGGNDVNPIRSEIESKGAVLEDKNFYSNVSVVVQQAAK